MRDPVFPEIRFDLRAMRIECTIKYPAISQETEIRLKIIDQGAQLINGEGVIIHFSMGRNLMPILLQGTSDLIKDDIAI